MACFFFLSSLAAYSDLLKKVRKSHLDEDFYRVLFVICYIFGYFGARSFALIVEEKDFSFLHLFQIGSMTLYGGFLSAFLFGSLWIFFKKKSFLEVFHICMPIFVLAVAIGRLGCFFNGDDYGRPLSDEIFGLDRYPVQLFESFFCFSLWAFCQKSDGFVCLGFYSTFRFFIEFLRGDDRGRLFSEIFSPAQEISLAILAFLFLFFRRKE